MGQKLPRLCTAFSQALTVNSFQWRIRDEHVILNGLTEMKDRERPRNKARTEDGRLHGE